MNKKYRDSDIERVRTAADIADVVGQYVRLKRAGMNRLTGLCPFHTEKTPSFTVDTVKQLYMCFGCHANGNVIQFYMAMEHVGFVTAIETLAVRYGAILTTKDFTEEARQKLRNDDAAHQELKRQAAWWIRRLAARIEEKKAEQWHVNKRCFALFRRFRPAKDTAAAKHWQRRATEAERRALKWAGYLKRIADEPWDNVLRVYAEYRRRHPEVVQEYRAWEEQEGLDRANLLKLCVGIPEDYNVPLPEGITATDRIYANMIRERCGVRDPKLKARTL